jgi:hypothetical protein
MNETNHPARRLRHGDRPTEPLTFEDAAANKAAEEGELHKLHDELNRITWEGEDSGWNLAITAVQKRIIEIIAADRAARPVANKAEVEGVASSEIPEGWPTEIWLNAGDEPLAPFSEYDELSWCSLPQGENDIRYVREDMLATPPATTGASTVLTDERIKAIFLAHGFTIKEGLSDLKPYVYAAAHAVAREVAAQAGQVAVPGWISVEDSLPDGKYCLATYQDRAGKLRIIRAMYVRQFEIEASGDECDSETNEANDMEYLKAGWYELIDNWGEYSSVHVSEGPVTHWMPLPAAPSPAKESK